MSDIRKMSKRQIAIELAVFDAISLCPPHRDLQTAILQCCTRSNIDGDEKKQRLQLLAAHARAA